MRILLTAGPTREPLDPVRYLSNRSTGAMGFALARAALAKGHAVRVVLGPGTPQPPVGVEVYGVETARDMLDATLHFLPDSDAIVCAAAVADYRPATTSATKIKSGSLRSLELVENPDIAAEVGRRRGARPLVVFALESEDGVARARAKLKKKNATLCVLNAPEAIGADEADFTLLYPDDATRALGRLTKDALAAIVVDELG